LTEAAPKKEQRRKFQAIRGTRDLLPPGTALWNHVEETAHAVFGTFGFGEIRPPIFEPTDLFARAVGGETDIVSKEMYTFDSSMGFAESHVKEGKILADAENPTSIGLLSDMLGAELVSLRPEATASV